MAKPHHLVLILTLLANCCFSQAQTLKVLPWNNHPAAVSLTFDDARAVHLDTVVPELNKRRLHATFFVIISKLTRLDDWRTVQQEGHEIGNHSVTHEHASALNKASEETEVEDAKRFLDSNFHANIIVFAYPYTEISSGLAFWVKKYDFAARGWRGDGDLLYVTSDVEPDWYNLPSQPSFTKYDAAVYKGWVDKAILMSAWTTLQIHGIGDPATGFEPIPTKTFTYLLDYLKEKETKGLWVAPFGEVAGYLRAQKIVEQARVQTGKEGTKFVWKSPTPFPRGTVLKVMVSGANHLRVYQGLRELRPTKDGVYSVSFDSHELLVKGEL